MHKIRSCGFVSLIFTDNYILPKINRIKGGSVYEYEHTPNTMLSFNYLCNYYELREFATMISELSILKSDRELKSP